MSTIIVFIIILVLAGAALHHIIKGRGTVVIVTVNVKSKKK